jgi:hypothetical protein
MNVRSAYTRSRCVSAILGGAIVMSLIAPGALGQGPASAEAATVPTSHANVHKGPSSNDEILVLVPRGTVLPVIGRRGEWVQVALSPELKTAGMVVRWYENEDSGWMHDSTVEIAPAASR